VFEQFRQFTEKLDYLEQNSVNSPFCRKIREFYNWWATKKQLLNQAAGQPIKV